MSRAPFSGILQIAANYVYFLLFAQFAFLEILQAKLDTDGVRLAMAAMGLAGLASGFGCAFLLRRIRAALLLRVSYLLAALVAFLSRFGGDVGLAALVGLATGALAVCLAAVLRFQLLPKNFALAIGAGTGLAYLFCNIPAIFNGTPALRAMVAAGAVLLAAVLPIDEKGALANRDFGGPALAENDLRSPRIWAWIASFLALIWLDSAAFAVIQQTVGLKGQTWANSSALLTIGTAHLIAALFAGWAIDRGYFRSLLIGAFSLFCLALLWLELHLSMSVGGPLYAVAVSLYSTALIALPVLRPETPATWPIRWRAAWLFGIAGWLGSAAGVGMAQDLQRVPLLFLVAAGALLLGANSGFRNAPRTAS